jgi:hypothetical protein
MNGNASGGKKERQKKLHKIANYLSYLMVVAFLLSCLLPVTCSHICPTRYVCACCAT